MIQKIIKYLLILIMIINHIKYIIKGNKGFVKSIDYKCIKIYHNYSESKSYLYNSIAIIKVKEIIELVESNT